MRRRGAAVPANTADLSMGVRGYFAADQVARRDDHRRDPGGDDHRCAREHVEDRL